MHRNSFIFIIIYSLSNLFVEIFKSANVAKVTAMGYFPAMAALCIFVGLGKTSLNGYKLLSIFQTKWPAKTSQC